MTDIIEKINTGQLAATLKELQTEWSSYDGLAGYLKAKPLNVDFEVNKHEIIISFDLSKDDAISIEVKTDYEYSELVNADISYVEIDNVDGTYMLNDADNSELLLQCKRIIHDAVHYKLLDDDSEIETNFYHEVYA